MLLIYWSQSVTDMFQLAVPLAEKIMRPIVVYAFLIAALRIFGKRELAQLNPFDLVVLLSLSNTVQNAIIGDDNSVTGGLVGAFALLATNYLVVGFLFRHRRLDQVLSGEATTLIEHGRVNHRALAQELLTESELLMVAHRQGFKSLHELEKCVLEPGGYFFLEGKTPPRAEQQYNELMAQLTEIKQRLDAISTAKN